MSSFKNYFFGVIFVSYLLITSLLGAIFLMSPALVLLLISEDWYRWYNDYAIRLWLVLPGAMFELIFGTKLVITGENVDSNDCPLIIMNHRCRLDWMFYWMALLRYGRLGNEKIILKNELKFIPGAGWGMQNLLYFFLQRKWEEDEQYLNRMLDYFIDLKYPLQLFMFPEGTDLCKESLERDHKYVEKVGIEKYEYCLHPRVKGFRHLVQKSRENLLDTVHDVTVGYPVNLCYGELDLLKGNFPKEIHLYVKRYKMTELPIESEKLDQWCIDRWAEKESRLKKFYADKKFTEGVPFIGDEVEQRAKTAMTSILIFWTLYLIINIYCLWLFSVVRVYAVIMVVFYTVQSLRGGTDKIQLDMHSWLKAKK